MRWIRPRRFRAGSCRRNSPNCGGRWKRGWASAADGSTCRCCDCSKRFRFREVAAGVRQALRFPAIAFDAVKHLVLCAIEQRPPRLDLENYPHLPVAEVALTRAADYQVLLAQEFR